MSKLTDFVALYMHFQPLYREISGRVCGMHDDTECKINLKTAQRHKLALCKMKEQVVLGMLGLTCLHIGIARNSGFNSSDTRMEALEKKSVHSKCNNFIIYSGSDTQNCLISC